MRRVANWNRSNCWSDTFPCRRLILGMHTAISGSRKRRARDRADRVNRNAGRILRLVSYRNTDYPGVDSPFPEIPATLPAAYVHFVEWNRWTILIPGNTCRPYFSCVPDLGLPGIILGPADRAESNAGNKQANRHIRGGNAEPSCVRLRRGRKASRCPASPVY
jgi:hypothetical protein